MPEMLEQSRAQAVGPRSDRGGRHYCRHGLLSRDVECALVRLGERLKNIRRWEKKFRAVLRPRGQLAELLFDKWWSCHLRQLLIAKLEADAFAPDNSHHPTSNLPTLEERAQPTLVWSPEDDNDENYRCRLSNDLLSRLAVVQRYEAHYSREGHRMLALLVMMRDRGEETLTEIFGASLGVSK